MKLFNVLAVLSALFLAGCASGAAYTELAASLQKVPRNKARVIFYRDSIYGLAIQPDIKVNGKVVGKSVPGGFFACTMKPGTYNVTAKTETTAETVLNLKAGDTKYVRMSITFGLLVGRPRFDQVVADSAKSDLKELKEAKSSCKLV